MANNLPNTPRRAPAVFSVPCPNCKVPAGIPCDAGPGPYPGTTKICRARDVLWRTMGKPDHLRLLTDEV